MTATLARPVPVTVERAVRSGREHTLRVDIQGLRAVAVLMVVLYHAGVPGVSGGYAGVDVFFVISGFLITGQIVREMEGTGRLGLGRFYARRMRRLLPAALLVVVVTTVVARLWGPLLQVKSTAMDALAASVYAINFRLAAEGVDYQQANAAPSPLQHFWSLAVEEQFYIVWPVAATVATLVIRRRFPRALRPTLALLVVGSTAASLWWSVVITGRSAPVAYFSVQSRAWEFGVGALVALATPLLGRLPRQFTVPASWLGLAGVVAAALVFDDATPFPGTAALLPVVGAGLFILAGVRDGHDCAGAARPLGVRPVQWIGKWSYSWYLWHWPVLVLAPYIIGHPLSWLRNLELMALALWVAALTYVAVERATQRRPLRTGRWLARGLVVSAAGVLAGSLIAATAPKIQGDGRYADALNLSSPSASRLSAALGAASDVRVVPRNLNPSILNAADDVPITQTDCHLGFLQTQQGRCAFGQTTARKTVVLFGDSHAQQWDGGLISAATKRHWQLRSWTKAACPVAQMTVYNPELKRSYSECDTWRDETVARIIRLKPDLVIASQSDSVPGRSVSSTDWAIDTVTTLKRLQDAGIRVIFLADTPYPLESIPTCLAAHLDDVGHCEVSRDDAYHSSKYYATRHEVVTDTVRSADITVADPIDWLCSSTLCPVIVGNTLVYRDESHITDTYSRLLGPILQPLLAEKSATTTAGGS